MTGRWRLRQIRAPAPSEFEEPGKPVMPGLSGMSPAKRRLLVPTSFVVHAASSLADDLVVIPSFRADFPGHVLTGPGQHNRELTLPGLPA